MKKITIIDYGSGNIHSAYKAFVTAANNCNYNHNIVVSDKAKDIAQADYLILPGVGAFGDCKEGLSKKSDIIPAVKSFLEKKRPFLGICVGMQLLADKGLEKGEHEGLGFIKGEVIRLKPTDSNLKIPHMGWNNVKFKNSKLFANISPNNSDFYFVHSYHFAAADDSNIGSTFEYGGQFTASIEQDNMYGVQFHPEKSQKNGLQLIANFLTLV